MHPLLIDSLLKHTLMSTPFNWCGNFEVTCGKSWTVQSHASYSLLFTIWFQRFAELLLRDKAYSEKIKDQWYKREWGSSCRCPFAIFNHPLPSHLCVFALNHLPFIMKWNSSPRQGCFSMTHRTKSMGDWIIWKRHNDRHEDNPDRKLLRNSFSTQWKPSV